MHKQDSAVTCGHVKTNSLHALRMLACINYNMYRLQGYNFLDVSGKLTDSLHGSMEELSIVFSVEVDERSNAASVRLREDTNTGLIHCKDSKGFQIYFGIYLDFN